MRTVLQRVGHARVEVDGSTVGSIEGPGLLALVGVTHDDTVEEARRLAEKTWKLRIRPGEKSASDLDAPILAVSQGGFKWWLQRVVGLVSQWVCASQGFCGVWC